MLLMRWYFSCLREALHPHLQGGRRAGPGCREEQEAACRLPEYVIPSIPQASQIALEFPLLTVSLLDRRWDADFVTLSKLIKNGSLGRISEFETHFDRHRPEEPAADGHKWKNKVMPGGSAVYDLGTHLLDQAVHLLGLPKRVTGFIGSARAVNTNGFEDSFTVLLHYANGTLVTAKATVVSPEEEQLRFWVRGDKGSFKKYHLDIQEDQLKAGIKPEDNGYGREPSERYGMF